jgi:hypothetical protein
LTSKLFLNTAVQISTAKTDDLRNSGRTGIASERENRENETEERGKIIEGKLKGRFRPERKKRRGRSRNPVHCLGRERKGEGKQN